jgi:serpin B
MTHPSYNYSLCIPNTNTLVPVVIVLGFPFVFSLIFGEFFGELRLGVVIGLIIEILWLYIVSCFLMKIIIFFKNELLQIRWNAKKFIPLGVIIIIGFVIYGFVNFGWGDVFIATADDSGATIKGVNDLAKTNNQFAIDLYSEINKNSNKNIFFSPWSISTAMAMAYEGARGETANEIQSVFHFSVDDDSRRSSYAKMLNTLNKASGKYELSTANAIWLQEDYPFLKDYRDIISRFYLGEVKNLDFVNNPSGASSDINNWVSKNTNNKIRNIVSPEMFDTNSRAVLTNAIYFKGKWEHQFDRDDTKTEDFTLESGSKIEVPIMRLTDDELDFNYVESDGVQILEMPYQGDKISMLILLPRIDISDPILQRRSEMEGFEPQQSDLNQLESILTEEKLQDWRNKLKPETVFIYMPKYKFETSYSLSDYLKSMGMNLPFRPGAADFSGMDGTDWLYIDKVLHKAYIDVYEEGTDAAATTMISIGMRAAMPRYVEFRADHPFIFIIQETDTGNILFMGRVNNPTQK